MAIGELIGESRAHCLELRIAGGSVLGWGFGIGSRWIAEVQRPARVDGAGICFVVFADLLDDPRVQSEGPKRFEAGSV